MPTPDYSVDLDLGEPPPEIEDYARQHCGEDPNTRLQAIYELRDMIYERGECTPHRMDDEFLIRFLRARNFIPQKAHRLLVNYYQFRAENPDLFENIHPMDLHAIGDADIMTVPPYRGPDGRRLIIYKFGNWDPKTICVEELFKATILSLELGMMEPRTQILGASALVDLEDLGSQHVWQCTPSVAAKLLKILVNCYPTKIHAIHIINHSWIFDKAYSVFKPFLNDVMKSRIYFHGNDVTSLHKHISPDYLPESYGGVWPDYSYTIWLDSLRKNVVVAKEMISCGYKFREHELNQDVLEHLTKEGIQIS